MNIDEKFKRKPFFIGGVFDVKVEVHKNKYYLQQDIEKHLGYAFYIRQHSFG